MIAALLKAAGKPRRGSAAKVIPSEVVHLRPHVRTRTYWKKGEAFAGDHSYYDDDAEEGQPSWQPSLFD